MHMIYVFRRVPSSMVVWDMDHVYWSYSNFLFHDSKHYWYLDLKKMNEKLLKENSRNGKKNTLTGLASVLIFPQVTASSGLAPESQPSDSWAVFTYTAKSAPHLWKEITHFINTTNKKGALLICLFYLMTGKPCENLPCCNKCAT